MFENSAFGKNHISGSRDMVQKNYLRKCQAYSLYSLFDYSVMLDFEKCQASAKLIKS